MILSPADAAELADRLFAVRCAAEDLLTAVAEEASTTEIHRLGESLLGQARDAERLR